MEIARMSTTSSADQLLQIIGLSQADNLEGYDTQVPFISQLVANGVRTAFQWQGYLNTVSEQPGLYGPWSVLAGAQKQWLDTFVTNPVRIHSRIASRTGANPDIFSDSDQHTEEAYAQLLERLCSTFIQHGKFEQGWAQEFIASEEGQSYLHECMEEFSWLERRYNTLGLSRLTAYKELLKTLLMVITNELLTTVPLPFIKPDKQPKTADEKKEYLDTCRHRLEQLYKHKAFDIRQFSERATGGKIGCSPYKKVPKSEKYSVSLRHYPLKKGRHSNGKIIYIASPLINMPEVFDLAPGKSVIEGLLAEGYIVYLQDPGDPGHRESHLGLDFYGKEVHDHYLAMIQKKHPDMEIHIMAYCMGGTLFLPYLARRAEERKAAGLPMDIHKIVLMASPLRFDDYGSGQGPMRQVIDKHYSKALMTELYGHVNVPSQLIEAGMNEIQPGVRYSVVSGFFSRAAIAGAIEDAAPFLYWLTHGTHFASKAHSEWIEKIFVGNQIEKGEYCLPSSNPELDGKPVRMAALHEAGVSLFDYRGKRDPISPTGSCVASELWGLAPEHHNIEKTRNSLNRTIEKHIGHIFVVSRRLLAEFLESVITFYADDLSEVVPDVSTKSDSINNDERLA
jgi:poly(3-hydroxyalkanoate) synthetase